jgi:hypothetical protein
LDRETGEETTDCVSEHGGEKVRARCGVGGVCGDAEVQRDAEHHGYLGGGLEGHDGVGRCDVAEDYEGRREDWLECIFYFPEHEDTSYDYRADC